MPVPERRLETVTAAAEKRLLIAMARRLPAVVTPDRLTAFGVLGAAITGAGFALSQTTSLGLVLAVLGLVMNWAGDSLDGTLARVRDIQRPVYGAFVDSAADMLSAAFIIVGLGLSAHMRLDVALAILASYYLVAVLAQARTVATGVYVVGEAGVGPTELRLALCALAGLMWLMPPSLVVTSPELTLVDLGALLFVAALWIQSAWAAFKVARELAAKERR
jgi:phosphatidylglycerophosphate synthase